MPFLVRRRTRWWGRRRVVRDGWIVPPISGVELAEWEAFEREFGPIVTHERIDFGAALVSTVLANLNRGKDRQPYSPADFLPRWGEAAPPKDDQSPEEIMAIASSIVKRGRRGR